MIRDIKNSAIMVDGKMAAEKDGENTVLKDISIYEVVRIMNGRPLFLREHLDRFENSFRILGFKLPVGINEIGRMFGEFAAFAEIQNGNVKIVCDGLGRGSGRLIVYESESSYPEYELYKKGVAAVSVRRRRRLPQAKKTESVLRGEIDRIKAGTEIYEVILVDEDGYVTEGSRSNVFFIKGDVVHTPPVEQVLPGITRMKVLEFCEKKGIEVKIHPIRKMDIDNFDGAFLTGTSINILPVKSIDGAAYPVKGLVRELSESFEKSLDEMNV